LKRGKNIRTETTGTIGSGWQLAFTSSRETPDVIGFYRHGVNACVVKPFLPE
jgi:hypothetical protein